MSKGRASLLFFLVGMIILSLGCEGKKDGLGNRVEKVSEENQIRQVVKSYNSALIEAYRSLRADALEPVASAQEVRKNDILITSLAGKGQLMISNIVNIDFEEIKIEGADQGRAKTREDWFYYYVNLKTGKEVEPPKKVRYELIYHLKKEGGNWKIASVEER